MIKLTTLSEPYRAYRFCLEVASDLLLRGNNDQRMVYVNVAGENDWNKEIITIWSGTGADLDRAKPRARISEVTELWAEDPLINPLGGGFDLKGMYGQGIWPPTLENVSVAVDRVAGWADVELASKPVLPSDSRLSMWAHSFASGIGLLDTLGPGGSWYMYTAYHGGWGTYYMMFCRVGSADPIFGISEEGHFAAIRWPRQLNQQDIQAREVSIVDCNLRNMIRGELSHREIVERLSEAVSLIFD